MPLEPTAWDWLFQSSQNTARALIVTLRDGTRLAGAFVGNSYVALHPYKRDLFLSEVWTLDEKARFSQRVAGTEGLYVDKSDILYIELFDYQEVIASAVRQAAIRRLENLNG